MKKIFTFCAAMLVALAASAATINVNPGNDALIAALQSAANGDVLVLADGAYNEYSNYIDFNKTIEVKAADGAKPVVNVGCYIKVQGGSTVKISGIKFDGTEQGHNGNSYSHFIRVYDNAVNNTLILDGCEICNTKANIALRVEADKYLNSLQINNCYFHDGTNCAINIAKSGGANHACPRIEINNSTFANYIGLDNGIIAINSKDGGLAADPANDVEVKMDHCTFYHNTMKTEGSTWGCLDVRKSANVVVSNCIFANPATVATGTFAERATQLYGGAVSNCLLFNTPAHRPDAITLSGEIVADPLFKDAANADYTISVISPAFKAGTDGKHLGDPRWWPAPIVDGYYLIYSEWTLDDLGGKFEENPKKAGEFMLNVDLTLGYGIKVCKVENEAITAYYPDGTGNEYIVDSDHAGKKCIYFDGTKHNGWLAGEYIWIDEWVPTGINNVEMGEKAVKVIENGQLYIIKNGVKINALGTVVK